METTQGVTVNKKSPEQAGSFMPWIYATSVFLILLALALPITSHQYGAAKEKEHQILLRELNNAKARFLDILENDVTAANTLAIVYKSFGLQQNYDSISKQIMQKSKYVETLQLTLNGTLAYAYPSKGYQTLAGISTLDNAPRLVAEPRAPGKAEVFFEGPKKLPTGGSGILCKVRIFEKNKTVGESATFTKMSVIQSALSPAGATENQFYSSLSKKNGKDMAAYALSNSKPGHGETVSAEIPQGDWILTTSYSNTYANEPYPWTLLITGALLAIFASLFTYFKTSEPRLVQKESSINTDELVENEIKFRSLVENALVGMYIIQDGKYVYVNPRMAEIFGYSQKEMIGLPAMATVNEKDIELVKKSMQDRIAGKMSSEHYLISGLKKNGDTVQNDVYGTKIMYNDQSAIVGSLQDIRRFNKHLHHIREEERAFIAREIHDELGQQLTGLKMDVSWISRKLPEQQVGLKEKAQETILLIDEIIKTVRRISSDLRPGILDDFGLVAALEWQSGEFEKHSGIKCSFRSDFGEAELTKVLSTCVFRIYQESLTNVMRHSGATHVETSISLVGREMVLLVKDNGKGFDTSAERKTLGLVGMTERAGMLGGNLEIISNLGQGTTITLTVPIGQTITT